MSSRLKLHSISLSGILFFSVFVSSHYIIEERNAVENNYYNYPNSGFDTGDGFADIFEEILSDENARKDTHSVARRDVRSEHQQNGCRTLTSRERNMVLGMGPCRTVGSFPIRNECTAFLQCVRPGTQATLNCCPVGLSFDHELRRCVYITEARCIDTHQKQRMVHYADDNLDEGELGSYENVARRRRLVRPSAPSPEWPHYLTSTPPDQFPSAYWNQGSAVVPSPPEGIHYFAIPVIISYSRLPSKPQQDTGDQPQMQPLAERNPPSRENLNLENVSSPPLVSVNHVQDGAEYEYKSDGDIDWYPEFDENFTGTVSKNLTPKNKKHTLEQIPTTTTESPPPLPENLQTALLIQPQAARKTVVRSIPSIPLSARESAEQEIIIENSPVVYPSYRTYDDSYESYDSTDNEVMDITEHPTTFPTALPLSTLQPFPQAKQQNSVPIRPLPILKSVEQEAMVENSPVVQPSYLTYDESYESTDSEVIGITERSTAFPAAALSLPSTQNTVQIKQLETSTSNSDINKLVEVSSESLEKNEASSTNIPPRHVLPLNESTTKSLDKPTVSVKVRPDFYENAYRRNLNTFTTGRTRTTSSSTLPDARTVTVKPITEDVSTITHGIDKQIAVVVSRDAYQTINLAENHTSTTHKSLSSSLAPPQSTATTEILSSTSAAAASTEQAFLLPLHFSTTSKPNTNVNQLQNWKEGGLPQRLEVKTMKVNISEGNDTLNFTLLTELQSSTTGNPPLITKTPPLTMEKPRLPTEGTTMSPTALDDWVPDLDESGENSPVKQGLSTGKESGMARRRRRVLRKRRKPKSKIGVTVAP